MRFVKKISERGVLTLPSDIREALEVEDGDIVEFEVLAVVKKKGRNDHNDEADRSVEAVAAKPAPGSTGGAAE